MDISSVEFPSGPIKVVYCLNRIEIRLQYQFIVCECLLNCFQSSHFSLGTRKCLNYWIINLKLGNRDVWIALQLCLVSGQGKKVFIVLNEGLLGSQILVEFLLCLWASLASPAKHCYYPNFSLPSNIVLPQLRNNLSKFPSCENQNQTDD